MSDPKLPTLDLRPITRDPHLCRTTVTVHWDVETKFTWIIAGRCQLLTERKPDFVSLEARMGGNATDSSHDIPYAFRLPLIGHTFDNVINHNTIITAWINPNEPEDFHVPASSFKPEGYDLREHPETAPCKNCTGEDAHLIVPYYVPPVDKKLFDLVRGKKVTISIGPAYPVLEPGALEQVREFAELWGYGRLMQFLSEEWRKKDPDGALSVGPCFGMLPKDS